jgi:hypothetical protein
VRSAVLRRGRGRGEGAIVRAPSPRLIAQRVAADDSVQIEISFVFTSRRRHRPRPQANEIIKENFSVQLFSLVILGLLSVNRLFYLVSLCSLFVCCLFVISRHCTIYKTHSNTGVVQAFQILFLNAPVLPKLRYEEYCRRNRW